MLDERISNSAFNNLVGCHRRKFFILALKFLEVLFCLTVLVRVLVGKSDVVIEVFVNIRFGLVGLSR